jgi:type IV pilus assembly protein PilC
MTLYKYKAKDKDDNIYERTVDIKNRIDIYHLIREEGGHSIISIHEVRSFLDRFSLNRLFSGIKIHQKITFAKNLGSMIEAGLPVTRALSVMSKQSKNKAFKHLLEELEEDISHGKTLSESLGKRPKTFSPLFVSMVRAGEESGSVSGSLGIIANQMEKAYLLTKKVRGALIYPSVILSVMVVIAILMLIYMVPTLTATFEGIGAELPLTTRILIALSNFLVTYTLAVLSAIILLIVSVIFFLRSKIGRSFVDTVSIRIPVIGEMVREVQVARTARTLSSLISAGVEIVVALDVTTEVLQNHLYKETIQQARDTIQKGESMSAIFFEHENLYPLFVGEMIAVGEETGKISEMLLGIANYYEEQVDQKTKDLSTIIEPVLMVIIGIGVGIFAISMLAPTYSLVDNF